MSADDTDVGDGNVGVLLLTPHQAAALCQVSVDRIYEWTHEPGFPVIVSAHQLRIHARLFDEWLAGRAVGRPKPEEVAA
jgi:hypothetical protein